MTGRFSLFPNKKRRSANNFGVHSNSVAPTKSVLELECKKLELECENLKENQLVSKETVKKLKAETSKFEEETRKLQNENAKIDLEKAKLQLQINMMMADCKQGVAFEVDSNTIPMQPVHEVVQISSEQYFANEQEM